VVFLVEAIL